MRSQAGAGLAGRGAARCRCRGAHLRCRADCLGRSECCLRGVFSAAPQSRWAPGHEIQQPSRPRGAACTGGLNGAALVEACADLGLVRLRRRAGDSRAGRRRRGCRVGVRRPWGNRARHLRRCCGNCRRRLASSTTMNPAAHLSGGGNGGWGSASKAPHSQANTAANAAATRLCIPSVLLLTMATDHPCVFWLNSTCAVLVQVPSTHFLACVGMLSSASRCQ